MHTFANNILIKLLLFFFFLLSPTFFTYRMLIIQVQPLYTLLKVICIVMQWACCAPVTGMCKAFIIQAVSSNKNSTDDIIFIDDNKPGVFLFTRDLQKTVLRRFNSMHNLIAPSTGKVKQACIFASIFRVFFFQSCHVNI